MPWPRDVRRTDLRIDYYRGSGPFTGTRIFTTAVKIEGME
jgi:hypothetical protein